MSILSCCGKLQACHVP